MRVQVNADELNLWRARFRRTIASIAKQADELQAIAARRSSHPPPMPGHTPVPAHT